MTEPTSPAERYAAARRRTRRGASDLASDQDSFGAADLETGLEDDAAPDAPTLRSAAGSGDDELRAFTARLSFPLDDFQVRACRSVEAGNAVLVAAPTGAGKTVVGEFAVHLALTQGRKAFYTTPIKALSNQKYADLVRRHGAENVGLLTGDSSINGDAPVVVMTTEVLRNMMYAGSSTLTGLGFVVMDEVHYLADRFRGPVWEEVIIHLPPSVQLIALSATVSNAEEFGAWLDEVRGRTDIVVEEHRPVPLWQHMMVGREIEDLFADNGSAILSATRDENLRATERVRAVEAPDDRASGRGGRPGESGHHSRTARSDARSNGRVGLPAADPHALDPADGPVSRLRLNPALLDLIRRHTGLGGDRGISRGGHQTGRYGRREDAGAPRGRRGRQVRGRSEGGSGRGSGRGSWGSHEASADRYDSGGQGAHGGRGGDDPGVRPGGLPTRPVVIEQLDRAGLLPAITFVFSRAGCTAAVEQLLRAGTVLIPPGEGAENRRVARERLAGLDPADLGVLGYDDFIEAVGRGFACHHAGMLPTFREIVEELFTAGRIRAVFATETLALGINMPARTVVLEKLVKYNGESHADITPAEYTQLTGRAGRRGIDVEGHAVVLWGPSIDPNAVAGLASTRTYPLRSSFRPTYNMAVNLVAQYGRESAARILETSFAQFQSDRSVVGMTQAIKEREEALEGYAASMTCHLGDFTEYARMRAELSELEKGASREKSRAKRIETALSLEDAQVGDVIWLPTRSGRPGERAVVLEAADPGAGGAHGGTQGGRGRAGRNGQAQGDRRAGLDGRTRGAADDTGRVPGASANPQITVLTDQARVRRVQAMDLGAPIVVSGPLKMPRGLLVRNGPQRRDLAATARARYPHPPQEAAEGERSDRPGRGGPDTGDRIDQLRRQLRAHPCHSCPDRESHARWAERWSRLEREVRDLRRRVRGRTSSVARQFDRVCDVLTELGYLAPDPAATGPAIGQANGEPNNAHRDAPREPHRGAHRGTRRDGHGGSIITDSGTRLRRLYAEKDLLAAESLRAGDWAGLDAAELAAIVSTLVHEPRREGAGQAVDFPTEKLALAHDRLLDHWVRISELEEAGQLPVTGYPDPGIAGMMHAWAQGRRLETVLRESDLSAGDFVRRCKQTVDLLDQIGNAGGGAHPAVAATARKAIDAIMRGVVAADRLD